MLAMAPARMGAFCPGKLEPERAASYNARALSDLHYLTQDDLNWRTLYDIACLAATSLYSGDYALVRAHFNSFNQLLPFVEISATHEHLLHFVLVLDVTFAMSTDDRPMLAWPDVLEKPCQSEAVDDLLARTIKDSPLIVSTSSTLSFTMGMGLVHLSHRLPLPQNLQKLLGEVGKCGNLARLVFQTRQATNDDAHAMCMSLLRLHHSLLSERFTGIAEAIRLCLILKLSYLRTRLISRSVNRLAVTLADVINKAPNETNLQKRRTPDLMLWIYIVGGSAATDPDLKHWYATQCIQVARALGSLQASQLRANVEKYFYLDAVHKAIIAEVEPMMVRDSGARFWPIGIYPIR